MLFNAPEFIFVFLPIVLAVFFLLSHARRISEAIGFLVLASLVFYGWWKPAYLIILLFSLIFNFMLSRRILQLDKGSPAAEWCLGIGISVNLGLIAYYKYTNFGIDIVNSIFSTDFGAIRLLLPLGISFFTFQQIAYLVDTYRGITKEFRFIHYCLFVTFFPQLIAGPIVHYTKVMDQFEKPETFHFNWNHMAIGLFIFTIGFFKKAVLADEVAGFANPVFMAADNGLAVSTLEAWAAALAYSLQLYFDFSGYSDMAIGLGFMFGIRLQLNFNSPYKAANIIDFWRRWHMTLSQFLRDYVYIPLGGNRQGELRRHTNLMTTMLIGGLWHGAGWNFVIWGGLHGVYLVVNHFFKYLSGLLPKWMNPLNFKPFSVLCTFVFVLLSWVFFRAVTLNGAGAMLGEMLLQHGFTLPADLARGLELLNKSRLVEQMQGWGMHFLEVPGHIAIQDWAFSGAPLIILLLLLAWFAPNSHDMIHKFHLVKGPEWQVQGKILNSRLGSILAIITGIGFFIALTTILSEKPSEFLYFNF